MFRMLSLQARSKPIASDRSRSLPQAMTEGSCTMKRLPGVISSRFAAMATTVAAEAAVPDIVMWTLPGYARTSSNIRVAALQLPP